MVKPAANLGAARPVSGLKRKKGASNGIVPAVNHDGSSKNTKAKPEPSGGLTFPLRADWHATQLPAVTPEGKDFGTPSRQLVEELQKHANSLLHSENHNYAATHLKSSSSHKFLSTIMSSGTWEDKVSAQTLLVQESPLHTMKALESLIGMAKKKSRNQALLAIGALKDLLGQGVVLPADRKLRYLAKQPDLLLAIRSVNSKWTAGEALPGGLKNIHLLYWAYEDWLKRNYFELLKILEAWCNDEIEHSRIRAITYVWELLKEKPEQEENLLRLLVNKLGDTEKKVASRASYLLLQLQTTHPLMKSVIINAIESEVLFRPGQTSHAKYYAVITLNQTILSPKEQEVANKLLEIYFTLFLALLKHENSVSKDASDVKPPAQGGGGKPGKKAKQKVRLKEQATKSEDDMTDKLIAQVLTGVNRAFPYAKTDVVYEKHIDTVFRVTHSANFNTSIQALTLIEQISTLKHYATDRFYRTLYESLLDPRLVASSKHTMYLNLLYKSLKADLNVKRVKAFAKRIFQILHLHEPTFICGALYLISQLQEAFPSIKTMLSEAETHEDDEEEKFFDVPDETESGLKEGPPPIPDPHVNGQIKAANGGSSYDARKRDPEFSNAHLSCLWEIIPFRSHFHPTVSLYTDRVLHSASLEREKPDLSLHTLVHFLDRFVYRNAKASASKARGASIMQPLAGAETADRLIQSRTASRGQQMPVNREEFWQKKVEDVEADEVFFHAYFEKTSKQKTQQAKAKNKKKKTVEAADSEDEEDEEEVWKALVGSRPELEGSDEGDDLDISGMESELGVGDADDDAVADELPTPDLTEDERLAETAGGADEDDADVPLEDEDAMIASDDDVPSDLEEAFQERPEVNGKGVEETSKGERKKRRKLKHLPTFASAEDYAKLIGDDDDEDV